MRKHISKRFHFGVIEFALVEKLKHVKLTLSLMIITVLLVSTWVPLTTPMTNNELVHPTSPTSVLSYEAHDYIYIVNDTDFAAQAVIESWEGDGSPETPFLIQGYEINPMMEDIHIQDTTLHFKILDCNITGALGGIALRNVTNGVIQNCLFSNNAIGIVLNNVTRIDVIGCSITAADSFGDNGVSMDEAIDCSISSCVIEGTTGTDAGIYGADCEGITLFNNTVFEWDNHGIFVLFSDDIDILNNTVYWNEGLPLEPCGIDVVVCPLVEIIGNNVTDNWANGISVQGSDNATVLQNHIVDNFAHGVFVELSDFCVIQENYIYGNGEGLIGPPEGPGCGVYAIWSEYCQILGNEFFGNTLNSISLESSDFCYIFNNYINHSYVHGMMVYESHNVTIEENEIFNALGSGPGPACGIFMQQSDDSSLVNNILGKNSENGITIYSSEDGEVIGNTIFDSEGIYMQGPTLDNLIYYNDIGWSGEFLVVDNGMGNYWNYSTIGNWYSDYTGTGTYTIPGTASEVDYHPSVSLYCGVTEPSEYEVGTTGNTMTWNSSALNPGTYELLIDSEPQGPVVWDGGAIAADVDGLAVGVYNVTLVTFHVSGHWLSNQSTLTVVDTVAPDWSITPVDQTLEYDEPLSYQVEATDPSGIASWSIDDTTNFTISGSGLITNATTLEPGVYYFEITVTDNYSNSKSITIMITVNDPIPPYDPTMVNLAIAGVGAGIVILLIVFVLKKKGT
jgi:parallel beta-helix repeat protein